MLDKEVIITAVSDTARLELMKTQLAEQGYEVLTAADVPHLVKAIGHEKNISLAVVDVSSFDESVWEQMTDLSKSGVPFFVISQENSSQHKEVVKQGASGLFSKGFRVKELLDFVHNRQGK